MPTPIQDEFAKFAETSHSAQLNELIASISHEISQPLSAISNYTATLRSLVESGAVRRDILIQWTENIQRATTQATEILWRMREFSREGDLQRTRFDVHQLIQETLGVLAYKTGKYDVTINHELLAKPSEIEADRIRIQQVISNLIVNACESFETAKVGRRLTIRTNRNENSFEIEVIDNGCGIRDLVAPRIFEAFFTSKRAGMGIGLSVARKVSNAHGGKIVVESQQGHGSTFRVELPCN